MISNQLVESCCFGRTHSFFFFFSAWYIVGEFSVLFYSDCFDRIKLHGIPLKFFVIFFSFLFYFLVFYFFFWLDVKLSIRRPFLFSLGKGIK